MNHLRNYEIISLAATFPLFVPASPATGKFIRSRIKSSVERAINDLATMSRFEAISIEEFLTLANLKSGDGKLGRLLRQYGSDKASKHDYDLVYEAILSPQRHQPLRILEIGLGSNNPKIPSNMGINGRPGASIRAFRDYLPQALVVGADIDVNTLFEDERIKTYFVDQTSKQSLADLGNVIPAPFNLMIDDGMHAVDTNLNTIYFFLDLLEIGGWGVIEDIPERSIAIWKIFARLASNNYRVYLIRTKLAYMVAIHRMT